MSSEGEQKGFLMGKKTCKALFTLTTVAVWTAFVYVIVAPTKQRSKPSTSPIDSPATTITGPIANGNSDISTNLVEGDATSIPEITSRFHAVMERLKTTTEVDTLMNPTTPQYMALDWIVSHDERQVDPEHPDLIQRYALTTLYFATAGYSWRRATDSSDGTIEETSENLAIAWLTSLHECDWDFITCVDEGGTQKRLRNRSHKDVADKFDEDQKEALHAVDEGFAQRIVVGLNLQATNMIGQIPLEIGALDSLYNLHLGSNLLVGQLPATLGNLVNLEILRLNNNYLRGRIPSSFVQLTNLDVLALDGNYFTGEIPAFLGNLTDLVELRLGDNDFSGLVPNEICNMENFDAAFVQPLPNTTCTCCD